MTMAPVRTKARHDTMMARSLRRADMLDSKQEELSQTICEGLVETIPALDAEERTRLRRALKMAYELIVEHFGDRIEAVAADFRSYTSNEKRLLLFVYAPY